MVHTCCTPDAVKERIFDEAQAVGADYIRVDIEMNAIFEGPGGAARDEPDWARLDRLLEIAGKHDLRVLGVLLGTPAHISTCPQRWPDAGRCPAADSGEYGRMAGMIAAHARRTIAHWEVVNEPDGDWAFEGTAEQYAAMLSAAHDAIKARVPAAKVVLGGLMRPHEPAWLDRMLATPGADALHKFDIANVHLRGPVAAVVSRYEEVRGRLAARGFDGPLWVTEHGYPADPAYQDDPAFGGGDAAQAGYLTQSLLGLGEVGAGQVFVTLRDNLGGEYASEGLVHIEETPQAPSARRRSFDAVRRLTTSWGQLMAWRAEQRENELAESMYLTAAAADAGEARTAREQLRGARVFLRAARDVYAQTPRAAGVRNRLRGIARLRALVAGRRTALFWHRAHARWHRGHAANHRAAVETLKAQIAGG
jgi:hypothetical protein